MKIINIKTIRTDGSTQSRTAINNETVADYAEAIKAGAEFPAIIVFHDGADNWLADGFHRFHAHGQAGKTSILADVRQGTLRDARLYAAGANGSHGLRRTNEDKRNAVKMVLSDEVCAECWTDREIAKHCAVSHPFVAAIRDPQIAVKQQVNRAESNARKIEKVESDSTSMDHAAPSAKPESQPVLQNEPEPSEDNEPPEYTELDAANEQIADLQADLVVARINSTNTDEQQQAATLIAELRDENSKWAIKYDAVVQARDRLMLENAELKNQCKMWQSKFAKLDK